MIRDDGKMLFYMDAEKPVGWKVFRVKGRAGKGLDAEIA